MIKLVVVVLIFTGHGSLWLAIGTDVGAMLLVTLNGMRLLPSAKAKHDLSEDVEGEGEGEGEEDHLLKHKKSSVNFYG